MKKIIVFLLIVGGVAGIYLSRRNAARTTAPEETVTVKRGDVIVRATETGSLEPATVVEIKSEQAGEVEKLYVQAGDAVTAGQPLALLKPESNQARRIAEAQAAIEQERLQVETARREQTRTETLYEKGFVARVAWEEAEKRAREADIQYDLATRQLLLTLGGNRKLYDQYLRRPLSSQEVDDFRLHAPMNGTVIDVSVNEGEIVSSGTSGISGGTTLMKIADLSRMWVKTKINEVNVGQLKEGQVAQIRLDAIPGRSYDARVVKISPRGERAENIVTYEVTLAIPQADARLMPSMTANVDILTAQKTGVLYLPRAAVTRQGDEDSVTLSGGAKQRVKLGLKNETVVEIVEPLKEGDVVVLPKPAKDGE
jgi:multidrug efflux pump subunit AcrA (membrane-fusion protein)